MTGRTIGLYLRIKRSIGSKEAADRSIRRGTRHHWRSHRCSSMALADPSWYIESAFGTKKSFSPREDVTHCDGEYSQRFGREVRRRPEALGTRHLPLLPRGRAGRPGTPPMRASLLSKPSAANDSATGRSRHTAARAPGGMRSARRSCTVA